MKRLLLILAMLPAMALPLAANIVHSLDINVRLGRDGSARITEVWNVTIDTGTEWYLVRTKLGDISISDFSVSDESGRPYVDDSPWDTDRSLRAKAGKYGILKRSDGVELCWGMGSYGPHTYTATYVMTRAVKSMDDFDCLHLQFVSPGLSDPPKKVSLTLSADGTVLSTANTRVWGFGYRGDTAFSDGSLFARSSEAFSRQSSMILLLRFDKGLFDSPSVREGSFDKVLERAMDGASFGEDDPLTKGELLAIVLCCILLSALSVLIVIWATRAYRRSITGYSRIKDIPWHRDPPFGGDIFKSDFTLTKLVPVREGYTVASAMILRMIQLGVLVIKRDGGKKIEIAFGDEGVDALPDSFRQLYDMMREASGRDQILQDNEFSRWSATHAKKVDKWVRHTEESARKAMVDDGEMSALGRFSPEGKAHAAELVGFRKFLKDYTLVKERASAEVGLWNDYLVFGALFGIADKVAKELSDIDPRKFSDTVWADPYTMRRVVWMSSRLSSSITNASAAVRAAAAARSGLGGAASFGGGGGFSGGGFGGGAR